MHTEKYSIRNALLPALLTAALLSVPAAVRADSAVAAVPQAVAAAEEVAGNVVIAAGKTVEVTVPSGQEEAGILSVSGPTQDGKTVRGGTLLKSGDGRLVLHGRDGYLIDHAALEYSEGSLSLLGGLAAGSTNAPNPAQQVRLNDAVLRYLGSGEAVVGYTSYCMTYITGECEFNVAQEGALMRHSSWLQVASGSRLIKTGPGALWLCPYRNFLLEIREGTFLNDRDNEPTAEYVVCRDGALGPGQVKDGRPIPLKGRVTFKDGASVRVRDIGGTFCGVALSGSVKAEGILRVKGLPEDPAQADGLCVISCGADFPLIRLPEGYEGYTVVRESGGSYVIRPAVSADKTLTEDTAWTPEAASYGDVTVQLNGHTLELNGALKCTNLTVSGSGALTLGAGCTADVTNIHVLGGGKVSLAPALLDASDRRLWIAKDTVAVVTSGEDIACRAQIRGLACNTGLIFGGTLRKEGSGALTLDSVENRSTELESVTLEIAGGSLNTFSSHGYFQMRHAAIRFVGQATGRWGYTSGGGVESLDGPMPIYVGEGVTVNSLSWLYGDPIKTGPGTLSFAQLPRNKAVIKEGVWRLTDGGDSNRNATTVVESGAVVAGRPGAGPSRTAIHFRAGAMLRCSATDPVTVEGHIAFDAPIVIEPASLPETPEFGLVLLRTAQDGLEFEMPEAYVRAGCLPAYNGSAYVLSHVVSEPDLGRLEKDETFVAEPGTVVETLQADLNGHTLTLPDDCIFGTVILKGAGRVVCAAGEHPARVRDRLVIADGQAAVTLPADMVLGRWPKAEAEFDWNDKFGYTLPGRRTADIEIAKGSVLTADIPEGTVYFGAGRISGPVAADGTVSEGGTFHAAGAGSLKFFQSPKGTLSHITLEFDGNSFGLHGNGPSRNVGFKECRVEASVIRVTGKAVSGNHTWFHTSGNSLHIDGTLTVEAAEGQSVVCDGWIREGTLIKTGTGRLMNCTFGNLTEDVREGTWVIDSGDSRPGARITVRRDAVLDSDAQGPLRGDITFGDGARIRYLPDAPIELTGTVATSGTVYIDGLTGTEPEGTQVLKCASPRLHLAPLKPFADGTCRIVPENGFYVIRSVTPEVTLDVSGFTELGSDPVLCDRLVLNLSRDATLSLNGSVRAQTLIVRGQGRVVRSGGRFSADRVVFDGADTRVSVSADLIFSAKADMPSTPTVEIAQGAEVRTEIHAPENEKEGTGVFYGDARISGPVAAGIVQPGGRLIKGGPGKLVLYGNPFATLERVTLDIADGLLDTLSGSEYCVTFSNATVRWFGSGFKRWGYRGGGCHEYLIGRNEVYVDAGLEVYNPSYQDCAEGACLVKTGAGSYVCCPWISDSDPAFSHWYTLNVQEGTYAVQRDHTRRMDTVVGREGAFGWYDGFCNGRLTLRNDASVRLRTADGGTLLYPGLSGENSLRAEGVHPVLGLPTDPTAVKDGQIVFHASGQTAYFSLPSDYEDAGWYVAREGDDYVMHRSGSRVAKIVSRVVSPNDVLVADRDCSLLKIEFYPGASAADRVLTVRGSLTADRVEISGQGRIVLDDGAELKTSLIDVSAAAAAELPARMLFSERPNVRTPDLNTASGAEVKVYLPGGAGRPWYALSTISAPTVDGTFGGTLRLLGNSTLVLQNNTRGPGVRNAALETAEGMLRFERAELSDAVLRVPAGFRSTDNLLGISGKCTLETVGGTEFGGSVFGSGAGAVLVKRGAGTLAAQFGAGLDAEVREGALNATVAADFDGTVTAGAGARLRLDAADGNGIPAACAVVLENYSTYEQYCGGAGTLTVPVGARAMCRLKACTAPDGSDTPEFSAVTVGGGLIIADLPAFAGPGYPVLRLRPGSTALPEVAQRIMPLGSSKAVPGIVHPEWYVLEEKSAQTDIVSPEGDAPVAPGSVLDTVLRQAAGAAGVGRVVLTVGSGNGRPLTVAKMNDAMAVFANALVTETQGDTLTATVNYSFAVSDIRIGTDEAVLTVTAADAAGRPLKLAPGAKVRLLSNGQPIGDPAPGGLGPDGTAVFRLKPEASASNLRAEAYTE